MIAPAKTECPHCHAMTSTASGFCDECGLELATQAIKPVTVAELMRSGTVVGSMDINTGGLSCPNCGQALRPNAKHCPSCGKKLVQQAITPAKSRSNGGPASILKAGLVIAERYGLESILGEGGMGRVWKAFDKHLNKYVVVKTVVTPDEGLRKALQREAEVLNNIRHPNIVAVIDFFLVGEELCYVMEYVTGPSWADEIEEPTARKLVAPMSAAEALTRVKALLPAFKYLHGLKQPIIYCDFKPSNVKSMELPNGERVEVLLDFGTAYLYDPQVPPKPSRGTPGYHSPSAAHPDWRDDYFTIGRTLAELVGMSEVHTEQYRYTLTPPDRFPWSAYDESFRYFVEWLTASKREERPQNVDSILAEIDGVLGYVKDQKAAGFSTRRVVVKPDFTSTELLTRSTTGELNAGSTKIDLPDVPQTNPAATVLLAAQEAYQQRNLTRALLLANQAVQNNGGAAAFVLRALIHTQQGATKEAAADLTEARRLSDPQVKWEMLLAEAQLLENSSELESAAERYRRMMALRPGDHRARLLLADLMRRTGNFQAAINEYRAVIQAKPSAGAAYIGASKAYQAMDQIDNAIKVLLEVSSRNTSYNDVMLELIGLYNRKAIKGDQASLEGAAQAIIVLREGGVESRQFYRLVAEFYYTACMMVRTTSILPKINWPGSEKHLRLSDLAQANETAWREYLKRDKEANRSQIVNERILPARTWTLI